VWESLSYLSPVWKPRGCGRLGNVGKRGWGGKVRWYRMGQASAVAMGAIRSEAVADGCGERFVRDACNCGMLCGEVSGTLFP